MYFKNGPLRIRYECEEAYSSSGFRFDDLNPESKFKKYGYSVDRNGLSDEHRKLLLVSLIEYDIFNKDEIINHISWLIKTNKNRENWYNAIQRWEHDLDFLNNYNIERQKKIYSKIVFRDRSMAT